MSHPPSPSDPGQLLRQLAQETVPGSPEDASVARRDRLVRQMKDVVERTAEKSEKSRRLRRIAVAVAAAASFALLGGLWLDERGERANVGGLAGVSGTVVLTRDGRSDVVAVGERALRDGDALQTAAGARAQLKTAKAQVVVSESTELRVSRPSQAEERISLRRGRVDIAVDKAIETKRAVVVETPDAEVVVRGTVFDVRVEPLASATNTRVHVTRGSVWVLAQGVQVALLSAGQSWSSAAGVEAPPVVVAPPVVAAPSGTVAPEVTAAPVAQTGREERGDAQATPSKKSGSGRKVGTLSEENRLFSAGVEARNRGDYARAAELFAELLSGYPQSTLREVAQVERFRALKGAGQATRASTEARRYLAEHPEGAARGEARELALEPQK